MSYGIPYQGSKQKIVKELCAIFPSRENFYDLFGGGFSVTHFMLENRSKDFKHFYFNEIRKGMTELVQACIRGDYSYDKYKMPWVSREEFFEKKESDLFIKLIWSFGNSGYGYMFGADIEDSKKSLHNAIVFNLFDDFARQMLGINSFRDCDSIADRRMFLKDRAIGKSNKQSLQLQRLERLQQLQRLERSERLNFSNKSYADVEIKDNSIIYCDIPYLGTGEYDKNKNFNHKDFYNWASSQENPVFISEYSMPDKRFVQVWSKKVACTMASTGVTASREMLYVNKAGLKSLSKRSK